ncbi:MAG: hypothetical protein IJV45_01405 [Prevotella sp.]|nr:hypothetical protein [Prevotella sp.]
MPRGVTIRGDWKKPQRGKSVDGTILMVQTASMTYDSEGLSFIVMQPTTEISNIAFWYPRQNQASATCAIAPSSIPTLP